jgi:putative phosphoribosyl transferase
MAAEQGGAVVVPAGSARLDGDLVVAAGARGVVLFAHGSGSSRHSPRNRQVAAALNAAGYGTLLLDLLTADEERVDARTREHRFDIPLLGGRLTAAADWLSGRPDTGGLPLATFGASTGAAAALIAAAERPDVVAAVISRGGRPDLAGQALGRVRAPTLLVVGGADSEVLRLNRVAAERLGGPVELAVVPGATHLFEEPGALEQVVVHATGWLDRWMREASPGRTMDATARRSVMSEPTTPPQPDDEQPDTSSTSDPSHAGGGRTSGETSVDDDLGRGEPSVE